MNWHGYFCQILSNNWLHKTGWNQKNNQSVNHTAIILQIYPSLKADLITISTPQRKKGHFLSETQHIINGENLLFWRVILQFYPVKILTTSKTMSVLLIARLRAPAWFTLSSYVLAEYNQSRYRNNIQSITCQNGL